MTALLVVLGAAADGGDDRDRSGTGMAAGASSDDLANAGRLDSLGMNAVDTCWYFGDLAQKGYYYQKACGAHYFVLINNMCGCIFTSLVLIISQYTLVINLVNKNDQIKHLN